MRIRVLTVNVQNDEGDPRRLTILNGGIRDLNPDLVALQEVTQLARLIDGTDLHGTHQADVLAYEPPWADKYGGNALASRWPYRIVEVVDQRLPDALDVPWCTLAAVVAVPDVGELLFIVTTTAWRLDAEAARERQVVALTDLDARHRQAMPTVMAGDFNAPPDAASIRYLSGRQALDGRSVSYDDAWELAGDGPGHTWPADRPRRIDYVFVGSQSAHPNALCRVVSAELAFDEPVDGVRASDHFGVVVDLEVEVDAA